MQEEEKKPAVDLEDEMEPLDSSEDSDSDEENAYQEDGFVVADDGDEGGISDEELEKTGQPTKNRLKRLRKGGKRKRLELDQEDLDLIAFAQGQGPTSKVPKVKEDSRIAKHSLTFSADSGAPARTSSEDSCEQRHPYLPFLFSYPNPIPPPSASKANRVFVCFSGFFPLFGWSQKPI